MRKSLEPHISLHQRCLHTRHFLLLLQNIRQRPNRRNLKLINLPMALGVVLLDVLKLRRVLEGGIVPVQMPHPLVDVGKSTSDIANVALEVLYVNGIEAHDCCIQTNVGFRDGGGREKVWR